jgi:hypothetical protein
MHTNFCEIECQLESTQGKGMTTIARQGETTIARQEKRKLFQTMIANQGRTTIARQGDTDGDHDAMQETTTAI